MAPPSQHVICFGGRREWLVAVSSKDGVKSLRWDLLKWHRSDGVNDAMKSFRLCVFQCSQKWDSMDSKAPVDRDPWLGPSCRSRSISDAIPSIGIRGIGYLSTMKIEKDRLGII